MQSRLIHTSIAFAAAILAACGGAVNETAASTTYNATYVGRATLTPISNATPQAVALNVTLTLSQIASTVTGTIAITDSSAVVTRDTVLSAGVTGHTTSSGLDLLIVQPAGCAEHFTGPLALGANGALAGTLDGSDCHATGVNNQQLTLVLTRQ